MTPVVMAAALALALALLRARRRRHPRNVTAKTVAHVMQLPELDGPRYRRNGRRRKYHLDGRP